MQINKTLALLAIVSPWGCKEVEKQIDKKPNVVIIFPDQLRRYSAGFWNEEPYRSEVVGVSDPVVTPTIDKLAKNGVVFTNAISNYPLCSPYRGMMLTGQYPQQNGIWGNCKAGRNHELRDDVKTITDVFYEAGYNTSYFGKCHWEKTEALFDENGNYKGTLEEPGGHLVNNYDTYVPPGASRHSIEYFYQALKDAHFDSHIYSSDPKLIGGKKDGELHKTTKFSAENEADQIIKYVRNSHGQRDEDKPFCMIWALNPPHNPWDDANTDMDALHQHYDTDKFAGIKDLVLRPNADLEVAHYARNYFANVTAVDKYVGTVIDELEKQGLLENTIVIFTSDHGEMLGSHGKTGKNILELESIAIPFIVHYPKKVKTGITDLMLGATDIMPTLLGLAGLQDRTPSVIQGDDFSKEILHPGTDEIEKPESVLLLLGNARGIQNDRYTLCIEEDVVAGKITSSYLYDNKKDPYQQTKMLLDVTQSDVQLLLEALGEKLKYSNDPWYLERKYADLIVYPE